MSDEVYYKPKKQRVRVMSLPSPWMHVKGRILKINPGKRGNFYWEPGLEILVREAVKEVSASNGNHYHITGGDGKWISVSRIFYGKGSGWGSKSLKDILKDKYKAKKKNESREDKRLAEGGKRHIRRSMVGVDIPISKVSDHIFHRISILKPGDTADFWKSAGFTHEMIEKELVKFRTREGWRGTVNSAVPTQILVNRLT